MSSNELETKKTIEEKNAQELKEQVESILKLMPEQLILKSGSLEKLIPKDSKEMVVFERVNPNKDTKTQAEGDKLHQVIFLRLITQKNDYSEIIMFLINANGSAKWNNNGWLEFKNKVMSGNFFSNGSFWYKELKDRLPSYKAHFATYKISQLRDNVFTLLMDCLIEKNIFLESEKLFFEAVHNLCADLEESKQEKELEDKIAKLVADQKYKEAFELVSKLREVVIRTNAQNKELLEISSQTDQRPFRPVLMEQSSFFLEMGMAIEKMSATHAMEFYNFILNPEKIHGVEIQTPYEFMLRERMFDLKRSLMKTEDNTEESRIERKKILEEMLHAFESEPNDTTLTEFVNLLDMHCGSELLLSTRLFKKPDIAKRMDEGDLIEDYLKTFLPLVLKMADQIKGYQANQSQSSAEDYRIQQKKTENEHQNSLLLSKKAQIEIKKTVEEQTKMEGQNKAAELKNKMESILKAMPKNWVLKMGTLDELLDVNSQKVVVFEKTNVDVESKSEIEKQKLYRVGFARRKRRIMAPMQELGSFIEVASETPPEIAMHFCNVANDTFRHRFVYNEFNSFLDQFTLYIGFEESILAEGIKCYSTKLISAMRSNIFDLYMNSLIEDNTFSKEEGAFFKLIYEFYGYRQATESELRLEEKIMEYIASRKYEKALEEARKLYQLSKISDIDNKELVRLYANSEERPSYYRQFTEQSDFPIRLGEILENYSPSHAIEAYRLILNKEKIEGFQVYGIYSAIALNKIISLRSKLFTDTKDRNERAKALENLIDLLQLYVEDIPSLNKYFAQFLKLLGEHCGLSSQKSNQLFGNLKIETKKDHDVEWDVMKFIPQLILTMSEEVYNLRKGRKKESKEATEVKTTKEMNEQMESQGFGKPLTFSTNDLTPKKVTSLDDDEDDVNENDKGLNPY